MKNLIFALAAIAMVGCAKDKTVEVARQNNEADYIKVAPSTTRAATSVIDDLKADPNGFYTWIYAHQIDNWYSDGNSTPAAAPESHYTHVYGADGVWNFAPPIAWPETESAAGANATYPLDFYALYPTIEQLGETGSLTYFVTALNLAGTAFEKFEPVGIGVVIAVEPVDSTEATLDPALQQIDYLSAAVKNVQARPASSTLSMAFDHIMSKIDFTVKADDDYAVHVMSLGFNHVIGVRDFSVGTQEWDDDISSGLEPENNYGYNYFGRFFPINTGQGVQPIRTFTGDGATIQSFYTAANDPENYKNRSLMLIPQDLTDEMWVWDANSGDVPEGDEAYIQLIYRAEGTGDVPTPDYIGFSTAKNHPAWEEGDAYTGPLFIKVGYEFVGVWEQGMAYNYVLELPGSTGGYTIAQEYYDERGNKTEYLVGDIDGDGDSEYPIVQPVLGDDFIHISPIVSSWNDAAQTLN